jgi:hypothetical protein
VNHDGKRDGKSRKNEAHPKTSMVVVAASIPSTSTALRWWCKTRDKVEALWRVARLLSREIGRGEEKGQRPRENSLLKLAEEKGVPSRGVPSGGGSGGGPRPTTAGGRHRPASGGRGWHGDMERLGLGRKGADRWVPWHSSGARSNEFESNSKFKRFI